MYRYILRESCSQFDSLPLTSLTIPPTRLVSPPRRAPRSPPPRRRRTSRPFASTARQSRSSSRRALRCIDAETGLQALSFAYFDVHSRRAGAPDDDDVDAPRFARRDARATLSGAQWAAPRSC